MQLVMLIVAALLLVAILSGVLLTVYRRLFPKPQPKRYTSLSRRSAPSHIQAWFMARAILKRSRRQDRNLWNAMRHGFDRVSWENGWKGFYGAVVTEMAL